MKAVYLIIGNCGVGKTWCMKELIAEFKTLRIQSKLVCTDGLKMKGILLGSLGWINV
jgi:F0F1-type ATP synthase beta subunit